MRVRFAPSPTGSLHLGNALSAVANRTFADEHGGTFVLRIDDTDPERSVPGGEEAILADLGWLGIAWDDGPISQSSRVERHGEAAELALGNGAIRDADGSIRLAGTTLARADGTPTYQLATVVDDLDLEITHIIRGSDHRPNEEVQQRIARALGGELPEVVHHGLLLGGDGKKLSKRAAHSSVADLRDEGMPAAAVRAYLDELGLPRHDVQLDLARLQRLAIDAIAQMSDADLAAVAGAPPTSPARFAAPAPWPRRARSPHRSCSPRTSRSARRRSRRLSASWSSAAQAESIWRKRTPAPSSASSRRSGAA